MRAITALIALVAVAAATVSAHHYTSWIATLHDDGNSVTFINFPDHNCGGDSYNVTNPLNSCQVAELPIIDKKYTWRGGSNSSAVWFENFNNMECSGSSILTRTYTPLNECQNCPWHWPIDCKQGPPIMQL